MTESLKGTSCTFAPGLRTPFVFKRGCCPSAAAPIPAPIRFRANARRFMLVFLSRADMSASNPGQPVFFPLLNNFMISRSDLDLHLLLDYLRMYLYMLYYVMVLY